VNVISGIPSFAGGGTVGATLPLGTPVLIEAHAGETVQAGNQAQSLVIQNVHFHGVQNMQEFLGALAGLS